MERYEYMIIMTNDIQELNRLGSQGWLVDAVESKAFRKNRIYLIV